MKARICCLIIVPRYTITHSTPEVIPQLLCRLLLKYSQLFLILSFRCCRSTASTFICYPHPCNWYVTLPYTVQVIIHTCRPWVWTLRCCELIWTASWNCLYNFALFCSCPLHGTSQRLLTVWCDWNHVNLVGILQNIKSTDPLWPDL